MKKADSNIKEDIIVATISLIQRSEGLVEKITIREIAQSAGVAVGLVNYHFGSKKELIEICVERIISQVMKTFGEGESAECEETAQREADMTSFIVRVFEFLLAHPEISQISMLSDLSEPDLKSNSSVSYRAILKALPAAEVEEERKVRAFLLLAGIQSAFLNRRIVDELLGFDLNAASDRGRFFAWVTEILGISSAERANR
ncbi:MAG: TetR/AcrR family transcriptional regulator [Bacillota bacterium]|nr:TetR/AcrR family transcriptional regulator [Bacillota bacterium]